MDTIEAKRIEQTNYERYQMAAQHGWQFQADAPDLLNRWQVLPFNQRGDKRIAFGVLTGNYQGLQFTMFDFHRRPTVTSVHTRWTNKKVNELDSITIDSVWAITLPVSMPQFQIVEDVESTFDTEQYPEPPTHDRKFNRWYKMIDTDPNVALQILTQPVMTTMRSLKLHSWSLVGNELVFVEHPPWGRRKPEYILEILGKLAQLVPLLPTHGQPHQAPPQMQQPQMQQPQVQQPQYQQPQYPQPQYQQPQYPQYPQPQYQQPQYPQQPYPQYPQPQYPQQPYGYPPQPGYPGYPPQQGY